MYLYIRIPGKTLDMRSMKLLQVRYTGDTGWTWKLDNWGDIGSLKAGLKK